MGQNSEYTSSAMSELAKRYELENKFLDAIACGSSELAVKSYQEFSDFLSASSQKILPRTDDLLRNSKNMLIILNTLCRKTVERSQVHPIYIDRFSAGFGRKIESLTSKEECDKLPIEMIEKYCSIVKDYSLATYSQLIRNTLTYINMNISSPITLKDVAQNQNVNASYLSAQFKREVGETLTDYIRQQRIRSAIALLNTTAMSIQDIAFQVGVEDISYFSKQFKKQVGMSPMQYRKMLKQ